ncbi:hypothetical protein HPP92_013104 [Vanilla planifolia]|uniref:Uncharacterized protein n=1 Tax=Vanilla planifolia TaxID=51239 RepID=A0A835QRP5_VANPL|nr:hypothetical protein HPP92_013104 [Vanilla planifolia]
MEETPPAVRTSSPSPSPVSQLTPPQGSQTPNKSEVPAPESNEPLHSVESRSSEFSPSIHETEWRMLPEFFDGKSPSKNPSVYKYYRDSIVGRFRSNPSRKTTFTEVRRGLVGDVGSIRRVFDFLEIWGLINYTPSSKPLPKEKKEATETLDRKDGSRKICSICKELCGSVCFVADKSDIVLCSRCFVRGNYRAGVHSADFKRVAISDETKTEWTDKETLHLVEAILHFGEDWKKVSEHVGSKNEKDCVARFIKLPFGEQFMGPPEFKEADQLHVECFHNNVAGENPSKQRRLTPLADASNPIMAQMNDSNFQKI